MQNKEEYKLSSEMKNFFRSANKEDLINLRSRTIRLIENSVVPSMLPIYEEQILFINKLLSN